MIGFDTHENILRMVAHTSMDWTIFLDMREYACMCAFACTCVRVCVCARAQLCVLVPVSNVIFIHTNACTKAVLNMLVHQCHQSIFFDVIRVMYTHTEEHIFYRIL